MENNIVKKSIFKQRVYRNIYGVRLNWDKIPEVAITQHEFIKENEIYICDLEMPTLKVNENFYIEELNQTVTIVEAMRTSKDNILYYTNWECIDDNITEESKNKANEELDEHIKRKEMELAEKEEKARQQIQNKSFWSKFKDMMSE